VTLHRRARALLRGLLVGVLAAGCAAPDPTPPPRRRPRRAGRASSRRPRARRCRCGCRTATARATPTSTTSHPGRGGARGHPAQCAGRGHLRRPPPRSRRTASRVEQRQRGPRVGQRGGLTEVMCTVRDGVHHSALGSLRLPGSPPDGPGVLALRHESTQLTEVGDGDTRGIVVARRHSGARTQVTVRVGTATIVAETTFPAGAAVGTDVGFRIPLAGRWAIPSHGVSGAADVTVAPPRGMGSRESGVARM